MNFASPVKTVSLASPASDFWGCLFANVLEVFPGAAAEAPAQGRDEPPFSPVQ